jgi:hypothetical protein
MVMAWFADVRGGDFPYAPDFTCEYEIAAIGSVGFLSDR